MAYGRRDGFSYADGVPLKLNDRLQPPAQIVLPAFNVEAPNLLENEYDFSTEQQALQQYQKHRDAKEAKEKARADKVAQEIEQFAQIRLNTGQQLSKYDVGQQPSIIVNGLLSSPKISAGQLKTDTQGAHSNWQNATLLNPQPLVNKISNSSKQTPTNLFNLADFESQSSSPFDTIELQTLNDLEELNTVFQGLVVAAPEKSGDQSKTVYEDTYPKRNCQPINGYQELPDLKHHQSQTDRYSYNGCGVPTSVHTSEDPMFPRLKGSKSTPDIRDQIIQQTKWNRSQTPPPYSQQVPDSRVAGFSVTNQTARESRSVSLSSPPPVSLDQMKSSPPASEPEQLQVIERLPNPYHELEEKQQLFVATVSQMGFNLDRVARAVKHLGTDDKKVVDHLCCVQRLEESGYDGIDAETALHLYDYNFEEAKTFLDLLKQFQDLGFQKSAARKALIRHKNDRDRALDFLLS